VDTRTAARGLAAIRVAIGAALFAAPTLATRAWIGDDAETPGAKVMVRGLGARDAALGLGALAALSGGDSAQRWIEAGALSDLGDLAATLLLSRDGGLARSLPVLLTAGGAAVAGVVLSRELAEEAAHP
jgi:hypothetical protein